MKSASRHQFDEIENLTRRIQMSADGDPDALSETIQLVAGHIHSLVSRIRRSFPGVKHLENTEADTTEIFLRLLIKDRSNARPYQSRYEFINACFATARNLLIDRLKWYQKQAVPNDEVLLGQQDPASSDPIEKVQLADDIELLHLTLQSLTDREYALVSLIYFEGYSQTEAFRKLDLAESTGRNQLNKIKTKLAAAMDSK